MLPVLPASPRAISTATSQSTDVLPLEFSSVLRPSGRLLLLGEVSDLDPFTGLRDARLWLRWREPDRDDAQIEIAVETSRDDGAPTARVLARASLPDRFGAWAVYRLAGAQGLVDLFLAGSDASPPEVLHLLVHADVSPPLGLPVDPSPGRYQ